MSFEIVEKRPATREPIRVTECRKMLEALAKNPDHLTAKIDMSPPNVLWYARNLGYKVKTKKIDNHNTYVWIVTSKDGGEK